MIFSLNLVKDQIIYIYIYISDLGEHVRASLDSHSAPLASVYPKLF